MYNNPNKTYNLRSLPNFFIFPENPIFPLAVLLIDCNSCFADSLLFFINFLALSVKLFASVFDSNFDPNGLLLILPFFEEPFILLPVSEICFPLLLILFPVFFIP